VWVSRPVVPAERVGDGARGWNIDYGRLSSWWRLVRRALVVRGGTVAAGVGGRSGMLLGPEGTAGRLLSSGSLRVASLPVGGGVARGTAGWYRLVEPLMRSTLQGVGGVGRRWGEGVRAGRSLRTAQWTRASF
jgi:hypothetical protein